MKILVLSDSHGQLFYMERALAAEKPDAIVHLGDHESDARELHRAAPQLPLYNVYGNCDFARLAPQKLLLSLAGVNLFLTHGHAYGVKYDLLRVSMAARQENAQVLLFGHTHIPLCEWQNGLWLLNPGTCSGHGPVHYGIVQLENGEARCEIRQMTREGEIL